MKKILLGMLLVLVASLVFGQQQSLIQSGGNMIGGTTSLTCQSGTINFYDDGGPLSDYNKGKNLTHTVYSPEGTRIRVTFSSVTIHNEESKAYLKLYNSTSASGTATRITTTTNPVVFTSTNNYVTFKFYSINDKYVARYAGWVATITVIDCPTQLDAVEVPCAGSVTIGGENIAAGETSYTANKHNIRTFVTDPGSTFRLSFSSLPSTATNNYVKVFDGPDTLRSTLIGQYSGTTLPATIRTHGNNITFWFSSNASATGSWSATLTSSACLEQRDDVFLVCSTDPEALTSDAICGSDVANAYYSQTYRTTGDDDLLRVTFASLPHGTDTVFVFNGEGMNSTLIGAYSGTVRPPSLISSTNALTIVVKNGEEETHSAWAAEVEVECPDTMRMPTSGHREHTTCNVTLYDNGGPNGNYAAGLNDAYVVLRPGINGKVLHLEGEYSFRWDMDYITIYDGEGVTGDTIWGGGLHGHGRPRGVAGHDSDCGGVHSTGWKPSSGECVTFFPEVTSKTGALTIRFHSESGTTCAGFEFRVTCVDKPTDCYHTGELIFSEDFGGNSKTDPLFLSSSPLASGVCSYNYGRDGQTSQNDVGVYVIRKNACDQYQYFNYVDDHTHPGNVEQGYLFCVDAGSGTNYNFYKKMIEQPFCEGTKLVVSFWVANINNQKNEDRYFPDISIYFKANNVVNGVDQPGDILATVTTGKIPKMGMYSTCVSNANDWIRYEGLCDVPAGNSKVWFEIKNNTNTTDGNDFVLDDIEARVCIPSTYVDLWGDDEIFSSNNICAGSTRGLVATFDTTTHVFPEYYYGWQRGENSDPADVTSEVEWSDIIVFMTQHMYDSLLLVYSGTTMPADIDEYIASLSDEEYEALKAYLPSGYEFVTSGEWGRNLVDGDDDTYETLITTNDAMVGDTITVHEPQTPNTPAYSRHYYRAYVAGSVENLSSLYCRSSSNVFEMDVTRIPEIVFSGMNAVCEGGVINLGVTENSPEGTWSIENERTGTTVRTSGFSASLHHNSVNDTDSITGAVHDAITVLYTTPIRLGGCYNDTTIPIYALPSITITPEITTICEGSPITLIAASNQSTSTFEWEDRTQNADSTNWTVRPTSTTIYTVEVTTSHDIDETTTLDCVSEASKTVTVLPAPDDVTVSGVPPDPVCSGTQLTFTPSATSSSTTGTIKYSWDGENYYTDDDEERKLTVTPTVNTTYTLYVKDSVSATYVCPATKEIVVEIYSLPTLTATGTNPACYGGTGKIELSASGGTPYTTPGTYYDFSKDNGSTYSHATTGTMTAMTFSDLAAGTYHVVVKDKNGCTDKDDVTITQPTSVVTATISSSDITATCTGQSVGEATVTPDGGTPGVSPSPEYTYSWSTSPAQTTATASNLAAGTYTVTVTDDNNCTATASAVITSRDVPDFSLTDDLEKCLNQSATLSVTNGGTGSTYSWSASPAANAGMPTNTTTSSITVTPTTVGTYTYTPQITAANGCIVTGSVTLTVNPLPAVTVSSHAKLNCFGNTNGSIVLNTATGGTSPYQYSIDGTNFQSSTTFGNQTISTDVEADPLVLTRNYTVTVKDSKGCTATTTTSLTQPSPITSTIEAFDCSCYNTASGRIELTITGGVPKSNGTYTTVWTRIPEGSTTPSSDHPNSEDLPNEVAGSYSVVITDINGCTATNSATINRPAQIVPNASASLATICSGSSTTITLNPTGGTLDDDDTYTYTWSPNVSTTTSATVSPTTTTTYNVTVKDSRDCTGTGNVTVTVNPIVTLALATGSGALNQSICFDKTLTPINIIYGGGATGAQFSWTSTPAPAATCLTGTVNAATKTVTISEGSTPVAGTYTYRVVTTDATSPCENQELTGSITIYPQLTVSVTGVHQACVSGDIGTATATVTGGNPFVNASNESYYQYSWAKQGGTDTWTTASISDLAAGTYNVTVTDQHCTVTNTVTLAAKPNPVVSISDVNTLCPTAGSTTLTATITTPTTANYTYTWTNSGAFAVTTTNPVTTSATSVTATATVPNDGCSKTYTMKVRVEDAFNCLSNLAEKTITVADETDPTIQLSETSVDATPAENCTYKVPDVTRLATVNDGCTTATLQVTQSPAAGTVISATQNVTVTVTDGCNHTDSETIQVVVPNNLAVTAIGTPTNNTCPIASGDYEFTSTVSGATSPYTYTWSTNVTQDEDDPSKATIASDGRCQSYPITLTVSDAYGCTASNSVTFAAVDSEDPTITCPSNIEETTDQHENYATITVPAPTNINDNCAVDYYVNGYNSTTEYPVGVTTVTYTIYDMCGNDETCSFTVTVTDEEPPCIGCDPDDPDDPFTPVDPDDPDSPQGISCESIMSSDSDNDDNTITVYTDDDVATYTHSGTDWDVTVNDNATAHDDIQLYYTLYGDTEDANASHSSSLDGVSFNIGTTTITWHAIDENNNEATCDIAVVVIDNQDPCIGCVPDDPDDPTDDPTDPTAGISCASITNNTGSVEVNTTTGQNVYVHSGTTWDVTAADNDQVASITWALSGDTENANTAHSSSLNGVSFNIGTTTVTWTVTDRRSPTPNTATCTFTVVVSDEEPPCIGCDPDPNDEDPGISCATLESQTRECTTGMEVYVHHNNETRPTDPDDPTLISTWSANWDVTATDNTTPTSDLTFFYTLSGSTTDVTEPNTTLEGQVFNIGLTTITWHVVDQYNNEATCSFHVSVADHEPPCIGCDSTNTDDPFDPTAGVSCASLIASNNGTGTTISLSTSENQSVYTTDASWDVTVNDNVQVRSLICTLTGATTGTIQLVPQQSPVQSFAGAHFNIGTTTVTWTATDFSGNTATCMFTVIVADDEPPCIGCDPDDPDDPFTPVDPDDPNSPQGISCASITNNTGTISEDVTPTHNYYEHTGTSWDVTANDNVGVASIECYVTTNGTTVGPLATLNGYQFPIGQSTVRWVVTDVSTLTSDCSFTVTVTDDEPPCIGCDPDDPDDPFTPVDPDDPNSPQGISCASITNNTGTISEDVTPTHNYYEHTGTSWDVTANDNVGVASIECYVTTNGTTVGPLATLNGYQFPIGQSTVRWVVTDVSTLTSDCSFTVTVTDDEPPCIGCDPDDPDDPFTPVDPNDPTSPDGISCASITNGLGNVEENVTPNHNYYQHDGADWDITANDNVGVASIECYVTFNGTTTGPLTTLNGYQFPIGTSSVRWVVTDQSTPANTSECTFTVIVGDNEPPCIGCDPDDPDDPFTPVDPNDPTSPDGISCASITNGLGNVEENVTPNHNYYQHDGADWDITANDNVGVASIECFVTFNGTTVGPLATLNGYQFPIGQSTVRWVVTDVSTLTSDCSFTVTVTDDEPPCIGCDPDDPDDPFTPVDPDDPDSPQGISCASITNNTGTISEDVTPTHNYYEHTGTSWDVTANDNVGVASIECYVTTNGTTVGPLATLNGYQFPIGTSTVRWVVTDQSTPANTSECTFTVVVTDNEPPCIGCDPDDPDDPFTPVDPDDPTSPDGISCASITNGQGRVSVNTTPTHNYYEHTGTSWDVTANDNVGIASIECYVTFDGTTVGPLATLNGYQFPIGTSSVRWVVTDQSTPANTSECTFTVVVTDDEPPCIGCDPDDPDDPFIPVDPDNPGSSEGISCASLTHNTGSIAVNTTLGQGFYQHNGTNWDVTANDNAGIASIVCYVTNNGNTEGPLTSLNGYQFPIGTSTVRWVVTDVSVPVNTSECTFDVVVSDFEDPEINCPAGITGVTCSTEVPQPYQTYAEFVAAGGFATDAGGIDQSSFTMLSQVSNNQTCPEVITRTYQIADLSGNTSECTQTITVNDNIMPVISGLQPSINVGLGTNCQYPVPDFTSTVRAMATDNCTPRNQLRIEQNPLMGTIIDQNTDVVITVYDACGNSAQITGHAVVPEPLAHEISFTEILCFGQTSTVTLTPVGGVAPYTGTGQFVVRAGLHNYEIVDVNGCHDEISITIPEPLQLATSIPTAAVQSVACYGEHTGSASVSVTGGTPGYTFAWSTSPQQTAQTATNLEAGSYVVTVTDAKGCTSVSNVTIEGQATQLAGAFANGNITEVACYGMSTGSATVTATGGTPGYSYLWNTIPAQTSANAVNLAAGNYEVTITDAHGCTAIAPVTINGQSAPLAASFANGGITDVACYGQSTGSATVNVGGGTPDYSYRWNTYPNQTTQTAVNLHAGDYVVTVTDNHGCTTTAIASIGGQDSQLVASFASGAITDVACYGEASGSATVTAAGGTPNYTYSWSTIPQQSGQTATNLAAGQYIVTVTDSHSCTATSLVIVNGQSAPLTAGFSNANITNVACYGNSTGAAMVTATGGTPNYQYSWNTFPVQTGASINNLPAGDYTVTVTDAHGCTTSNTVTISQSPLLEATTTTTDANCGVVGGNIAANVVGGSGQYIYSWTNAAGQTYSGLRLNNVMPSTYNLIVTDYNGCTATATANVGISGSISAHIEVVRLPGCGSDQNAGSMQAVAESGISPFIYQWGNGTNAQVATGLSAGTYNVTITDSWGCSAVASLGMEQDNTLEISVASTPASCYGMNDASATIAALHGEPPYSYSWSTGATVPMLQNVPAGHYSVTVTDSKMCTLAETIDVEQPDRLMIESNVKQISCFGKKDGSIAMTAIGGTQPYSFSVIMDNNFFTGSYMTSLPAGTYNLEVTDVKGCISSNTIQIVEPEGFSASYNVTMPSCSGNNNGTIEISATGGTKPYMYGWDSFYSDVPLLTGLREGQYTINVVDANKCSYKVATIVLTDIAGDCIKIPNVFTPNEDGINDQWIIENIDMFPDATVYVFNRWGQMLYKARGNDEPWDGTYNGHKVPAGTYLYIVDLYQKTEAYKGTVTIVY